MRPATRIGRTVIFPGGQAGRLTLRAYLLFKLGLKDRVRWDDLTHVASWHWTHGRGEA